MNEILTVSEAASYLKKHPNTIRRWIMKQKLPARKIVAGGSGVFVILRTDLLELAVSITSQKPEHPQNVPKRLRIDPSQEHMPI